MLIDKVAITVKAGDGGDGAVSFRRNAQTAKGGPDGGNGGNGGSVYFQASTNISDLKEFQYKKKIHAEDGVAGRKNNLFGRNGMDLIVSVPVGTMLVDSNTGEIIHIEENNKKVLVARGGKGGRGNDEFKSAINQAPEEAEKGTKGEEKKLIVELRLIADIGLVGFPNSGKSTLLSLMTNAKPKIGNYPFTTLDPNLGLQNGIVLADIPGVIKGASKGKGLGLQFLKHIEKTRILVYCIDSTDEGPPASYEIIRDEFTQYDPALLQKPEIIVLTKSDLTNEKDLKEKIALFSGKKVLSVSQNDSESIERLQQSMKEVIDAQT